jgi:hypothetical protein
MTGRKERGLHAGRHMGINKRRKNKLVMSTNLNGFLTGKPNFRM